MFSTSLLMDGEYLGERMIIIGYQCNYVYVNALRSLNCSYLTACLLD